MSRKRGGLSTLRGSLDDVYAHHLQPNLQNEECAEACFQATSFQRTILRCWSNALRGRVSLTMTIVPLLSPLQSSLRLLTEKTNSDAQIVGRTVLLTVTRS